MLTVARPVHKSAERWWRRLRFEWARFLIAWCASFHLLLAFTLIAAPWHQIYNQGTAPVLDVLPRTVWALIFAVVGLGVAWQWQPGPRPARFAVWLSVLFLGGWWLSSFALAVFSGKGGAIGVVVWPFLYGPWSIVAVRDSLGKR